MKPIQLLAFALIFFSIFSCTTNDQVDPSGAVVQKDRNITGFSGIDVRDGIKVFAVVDTFEKVTVEANSDILQYIITRVENNNLVIEITANTNIGFGATMNVYVTAPGYNILLGSGGSKTTISDTVQTVNLGIGLSGGSVLNVQTVEIGGTMATTVSGGSSLSLAGNVNIYDLNSSGGSTVEGFNLVAKFFDCVVSGGGLVNITVTDELRVTASGGSSVNYKGTGTVKSQNIEDGSSLTFYP